MEDGGWTSTVHRPPSIVRLQQPFVSLAAAGLGGGTATRRPFGERAERELGGVFRYTPSNAAAFATLNLVESLLYCGQFGRLFGHDASSPTTSFPRIFTASLHAGNVSNLLVPTHVPSPVIR
jgi:hypothetical protein